LVDAYPLPLEGLSEGESVGIGSLLAKNIVRMGKLTRAEEASQGKKENGKIGRGVRTRGRESVEGDLKRSVVIQTAKRQVIIKGWGGYRFHPGVEPLWAQVAREKQFVRTKLSNLENDPRSQSPQSD